MPLCAGTGAHADAFGCFKPSVLEASRSMLSTLKEAVGLAQTAYLRHGDLADVGREGDVRKFEQETHAGSLTP